MATPRLTLRPRLREFGAGLAKGLALGRMISHKYKFIFIHIPKTGGNSIQTVLAPFSDDRILALEGHHQDGVERFMVRGRLTPSKHVELDYYARFVKLERFKVVACWRDPVERLLSSYFSPCNWYVRCRDDTWRRQEPYWDRKRFLETLTQPSADYLKVGGTFRDPDFLLGFDRLATDFAAFLEATGIPAPSALPKLNARGETSEALDSARADPLVHETAYGRYREDYERFGIALP